jgi:hemerythrin-like metal-binding protein
MVNSGKLMPLVEWTPSLSVDVKEFDAHHQHLFDLLNTLHDCMRVGRGHEVIDEVVNALDDYAKRHFSAEEKLMRRTGYSALHAHKIEHARFIATVARLQKLTKSGRGAAQTHKVVTFLQEWLKHHIAKTDRAYGPHMVANRIT